MITKLQLKNWRSHLDTNIDFSEGTNCFIGSMGAGKTSILDAICFALFGTFPTLQSKKIKLEDIIMKKPKKQDRAEVSVTFQLDDNEWTVKRLIDKGRTTAELRKNAHLVESPQSTKVTKQVNSLLKLDYDLFTRAIYSEQNQLDMFLTIPKGLRMKKIDQLLSIDKFEKAKATAKQVSRKLKTSIEEKKQVYQNLESDDSLKKLDTIKRELEKLIQDKNNLDKKLSQTTDRRKFVEKEVTNLKKQQKRIQEIEEQIKTQSALLEVAEKDIEKLKECLMPIAEKTDQDLEREFRNLTTEISKIQESLEKERSNFDFLIKVIAQKEAKVTLMVSEKIPELEEIIRERDELKKKLKKLKVKDSDKKLSKLKKELEFNQLALQRAQVEIEQIDKSITEFKKLKDSCPICDNKLSSKKKKIIMDKKKKNIRDLQKTIVKSKKEIKKLKSSVEELERDLSQIDDLIKRYENIKDKDKELKFAKDALKVLRGEIFEHLNERKMLEKTLSMIQKKTDELKERRDETKDFISKKKEVNDKFERIKEYNNKVNDLKQEKQNYSRFSATVLENLEKEFKDLIVLEKEIETNMNNISSIAEEKKKRLDEIQEKIGILEKYQIDISKMNILNEQMYLLEKAIVSTQEQLRKNFVSAVNQAMEAIWPELYPYKDLYGVRLGIEEGDYILQLEDSTGWIPADGTASGGERSIACLALRIAFALVLAPQLRWLVLDEPTHNLDSRAVEDLANVLRDKVSEFVDQIFLITHDPNLETAVSGYLYRLERDKEKDGFSKVVKIAGPEEI